MLNKALLLGSSKIDIEPGELLYKVKCVVSEEISEDGNSEKGFISFDGCEDIEGTEYVFLAYDSTSKDGVKNGYVNAGSNYGEDFVIAVNHTNGVKRVCKRFFYTLFTYSYGLFDGIELGEECVLSFHKKA